jgi:hypothetical protein
MKRKSIEPLQKIVIRNADFEVIREVIEADELVEIQRLLADRSKVPRPETMTWTHKFDFVPGSRWLYSTDGYFCVLSKANVPFFKILDAAGLNQFLGIADSIESA